MTGPGYLKEDAAALRERGKSAMASGWPGTVVLLCCAASSLRGQAVSFLAHRDVPIGAGCCLVASGDFPESLPLGPAAVQCRFDTTNGITNIVGIAIK